jgi:O-antigen ligase
LFSAVFVLTGLLAYLSPLGLAPLVGVAGLASLWAPRGPPSRVGVIGLGALFLWAGASLAWSPARPWEQANGLVSAVEHLSLLELGAFAVLAALAVGAARRLEPSEARLPNAAFRWSVFTLALVLTVDSVARGAIYGSLARLLKPGEDADLVRIYAARGGYVLAVLVWPWLGALSGRARWLALSPFAAVAAVSLLLHEAAPLAALLAGSAAFALVALAGTKGLSILGGVHAAYWLGAPWVVQLTLGAMNLDRLTRTLKNSWSVRLGVWRFAANRAAEHPWRGWGIDASRAFGDAIPLHPHDSALQVWLELGLPGALLITALWLGLLRRAACLSGRAGPAGATAAMTAYLTIGSVSFGVWQPWWLAVGVLAVIGSIIAARAQRSGGA